MASFLQHIKEHPRRTCCCCCCIVAGKAETASALAPSAEPALKPNQPKPQQTGSNQYIQGILAGGISLCSMCTFYGRFNTRAPARAAQPAEDVVLQYHLQSPHPCLPGSSLGCHVQCVIGAYTSRLNSAINKNIGSKTDNSSATAPAYQTRSDDKGT